MMKKERTVEEILAEYPKEIVNFWKQNLEIDGWEIQRKIGGYLPSPAQQFINKLSKKENEVEYEVIFTFKRRKDESDKNG